MTISSKLALLIIVSCVPLLSHAWPAAVDWEADNNGAEAVRHTVAGYDRCDTVIDLYTDKEGDIVAPINCHRWNLIWGFDGDSQGSGPVVVTLTPQVDWVPNVTATDYRLPTIKELIRLYSYAGSKGITDPVIAHWLAKGCRDTIVTATVGGDDESCDQVGITLKDNVAAKRYNQIKDGYLISSTYRDIDGVDDNGFAHFFGIRIKDGKVVVFEAGGKGPVFSEYVNKAGMLALCPGLLKDGSGKITGACDYKVDGKDDATAKKHAADYAVVPIYALLVKEAPLVQ